MLARMMAIAAASLLTFVQPVDASEPKDRTKPPQSKGLKLKGPQVRQSYEGALRWEAPQGGETFCLWGSYPLIWTGGGSGTVFFSLIDHDQWRVVDGGPEGVYNNTGKLTWQIPSNVEPGDYQMYVQREDGVDWRYSAVFRIKDCGCD